MKELIRLPNKCSKSNKYILYFLIFCTLRNLVSDIFYSFYENVDYDNEEIDNIIANDLFDKYFDIISNFMSDFLTIFIYLYQKFNSRSDNYYENQEDSVIRTYKKCTLLIIAIVDIICQILPITYFSSFKNVDQNDKDDIENIKNIEKIEKTNDNLFFLIPIDVLSRYIFSKQLFKANYYDHHKLSYLLIIVGSIPLFILESPDFIKKYFSGRLMIYLAMKIIVVVFYSLEDVLNKRALVKYLPAKLIVTKAMIQSLMIVVISIIFILVYSIFGYNFLKNFKNIFSQPDYLFYRISYIFFNIFRTYTLVNIIFELGPESFSVPKVLEAAILFVYYHIRNLISGRNDSDEKGSFPTVFKHILQFTSFIILAIGSLLHNEFFMLNIKGFVEKTKWYMENVEPKLLENNRKSIEAEDEFD